MTLGGNALEGESDGGESEEGCKCKDEGENDEWREKGVSTFWGTKRDIDGVVSVVCV